MNKCDLSILQRTEALLVGFDLSAKHREFLYRIAPMFAEMVMHFERLPKETFIREVWHTHSKQHRKMLTTTMFPDRAKKLLGYLLPMLHPEYSRTTEYRIRWVVIEDSSEVVDNFAAIFDYLSVYTTLNHYPLEYGLARLAQAHLEHKLYIAKRNTHTAVMAELVPILEKIVAKAKNEVPKSCYVDLAFDFDVGGEKEIATISDAIPYVQKLVSFCQQYEIPFSLHFSGNRGFHVVIPYSAFGQTMAEDNHLINRKIAELIQEETGTLHIDPAIYSNRRQFRLEGTRHQKSGLFKVALSPENISPSKIPDVSANAFHLVDSLTFP